MFNVIELCEDRIKLEVMPIMQTTQLQVYDLLVSD